MLENQKFLLESKWPTIKKSPDRDLSGTLIGKNVTDLTNLMGTGYVVVRTQAIENGDSGSGSSFKHHWEVKIRTAGLSVLSAKTYDRD